MLQVINPSQRSECTPIDFSPVLRAANSPEGRLICEILMTFILDMNALNRMDARMSLSGRDQRLSVWPYTLATSFNGIKRERLRLIKQASSAIVKQYCELIGIDHEAFMDRLKRMHTDKLIVDLSDRKDRVEEFDYLEEVAP